MALEAPLEGPGGAEDGPESFLEEGVQGPSPADRNRRRGRPRGESLGGGLQVVPRALRPHEVSLRGGTQGWGRWEQVPGTGVGGTLAEPTGKELLLHTEQTASGRGACSLPGAGAPERLCLLQESRARSNAERISWAAGLSPPHGQPGSLTAAESHRGQ